MDHADVVTENTTRGNNSLTISGFLYTIPACLFIYLSLYSTSAAGL